MLSYQNSQTWGESIIVPVIGLENDNPVARGVAILARAAQDEAGSTQGWIGFVECVKENPEAVCRVLERCEDILRQAGAKSVLMPKVDSQLLGLQTNGFALPQTFLTNHNPPHYLELLKNCGYHIKTNIYTLYFTRETVGQVEIEIPDFTTREFDRSNLSEEIIIFHELQQAIFGGRSGYIPRTFEEDRNMVKSFLPFLQDDLVIIAEDLKANPVGLLVCIPDMYQAFRGQKIDRARILSIGVLPALTHRGIGALMGAHLMRNLLLKKEYVFAEGSWILATNKTPRDLAKKFRAKPGREFALLEKKLLH